MEEKEKSEVKPKKRALSTYTEVNKEIVQTIVNDPTLLQNKRWRMENMYWIKDKDGNRTLFKMNRAQKHFFDNYLDKTDPKKFFYRHIILKSRQLGFTTFIALYMLDEALFNANKSAMFVAHIIKKAQETFDGKVYYALRNIAEDLSEVLFKVNKRSTRKLQIFFESGEDEGSSSDIQVDRSGRGDTIHLLHISEFAKMCAQYPGVAQEVVTGAFPAVPFDGQVFIESTAEGMSGDFYNFFNKTWYTRYKMSPALSRVDFMPHFYNWQYDDEEMKKITDPIPTKDMEECEIDWEQYKQDHNLTDIEITYYYMKYRQLNGDITRLHQEYPTTPEEAFVSTGTSYFSTIKVSEFLQKPQAMDYTRGYFEKTGERRYKFVKDTTGDFYMWKDVVPGEEYVIGGDTSEGLAHGDYQVASVISRKTEEFVGLYFSKIPPEEFVFFLEEIGYYYNTALLAVEVQKDGRWVNNTLEANGYPRLYFRKQFDDITKAVSKLYGWSTNKNTRDTALVALRSLFNRSKWLPAPLLQEMLKFIRNTKGKPEAMSGEHDDIIMASAIAAVVTAEMGKQLIKEEPGETDLMSNIFG